MNDHLIKNLRISLIKSLFGSLILGGLFFYSIKPTEWYYGFLYLIYPLYLTIKQRKIILEIKNELGNVKIDSYSIIRGKQELNLNISEIIELDFFNGFVIKYKDRYGKTTETYEINAEPWNNIFEQIKYLKITFQELEKNRKL
ncbi:hypothetical protein A8C32_06015 [Flavivirga aquatica]|uniref:Uncharacterized protein n=1 Tax=Flavivirga aquatica TaxID=1849968 RepID=A0A1E5SI13_9FLAO|nr:hypothetical protein [Flavivirga aquatica]OEJ98750.1 hypothetical protein A8C32_06015 [Flavivirga aquatica]